MADITVPSSKTTRVNRKSTSYRLTTTSTTTTMTPSSPELKSSATGSGRRKTGATSSSSRSAKSSRSAGRGSTTPSAITSGSGTILRGAKTAVSTTVASSKKSGSKTKLDDSTNKSECTPLEEYDRDCLNDGECFAVEMRTTTGKQFQRVVGCSCPPVWKGERCENRHFDSSIDNTDTQTVGIAIGVVLGFLVLFVAVVGGATYCWLRKRRQVARQSTLKRPLKAEPSNISGGGAISTPLYVDTEKFTYGRYGTLVTVTTGNGGNTWTATTTVATCDGQKVPAVCSSDHQLLTPTKSLTFSAFNPRGSTSSSPVPLSPTSSLRHHECQTCAAVSAGLHSVPEVTPTTSTKSNVVREDSGTGETSRQRSLYDNCRPRTDARNDASAVDNVNVGWPAAAAKDATSPVFYFGR